MIGYISATAGLLIIEFYSAEMGYT